MKRRPNPKLNVLTLQREKRYVTIDGKKKRVTVLALTDQHGKVQQVAKSRSEQEELRRWYREYNMTIRIQDLPESKEDREKVISIISDLRDQGFVFHQRFWGVHRNRRTRKQEYKRWVVYKHLPWTEYEVRRMWAFFRRHVPKSNLAIFALYQGTLFMHHDTMTG